MGIRARIERLEERAPASETRPGESYHRWLVRTCLEHFPLARPGVVSMVDSSPTAWGIHWPFVWQFHQAINRIVGFDIPGKFDTREAAQAVIDWTYTILRRLDNER